MQCTYCAELPQEQCYYKIRLMSINQNIYALAKNFFTRFYISMGFKQSLEKTLIKFGKNNSPTVIAMSIAVAKGIFRPTFTMMDKTESYETKRYTALREGLTELIAIPVYFLSGVCSKKAAEKLAVPKNFMSKNLYKKHLAGDKSIEVVNAFKHAEELAKINLPKISANASFAGVCLSALLIIPFLCSVAIKPIMKQIENKNNKTNTAKEINTEIMPFQKPDNSVNTFKGLYKNIGGSMKVGSL